MRLFSALTLLPLLLPGLAHAQQFEVVDLGVLPGHEESRAWGMNGKGQVVGWSRSGSVLRAIVHDPLLGLSEVGSLPGDANSAARGISEEGHVVGSSWDAPISQPGEAFRREPSGVLVGLGSLPAGTTSEAWAVNRAGTAVGLAQGTAFSPEPFVAPAGAAPQSLSGGVAGQAWAIDEAGWVAGEVNLAPVLWDPSGAATTLPTSAALPRGRAQAINGSRVCAGIVADLTGTTAHLAVWDAAGLQDLGIIGRYSQVTDLGDSGWVVGYDQFSFQVAPQGFLYRPGVGLQHLDDLLTPASSGWQITSVFAVNEHGQLAANGIDASGAKRALRLDPVTPPDDLQVTTLCLGLPNSTGQPGGLSVTQLDLVQRSLQLNAVGLPTNVFGISLVSREADHVALPGGSQGNLCLGGEIARAVGGAILTTGATGSWSEAIDLDALPFPTGSPSVQPGETLHFQAWYRDTLASGATTSNFTAAVRVQF